MKTLVRIHLAAFVLLASACSRDATLDGTISDDHCGGVHVMDEHALIFSDQDCATRCIKDGAKYVLVTEGGVYAIENQEHAALATHNGRQVRVTGLVRDRALNVSSVSAP